MGGWLRFERLKINRQHANLFFQMINILSELLNEQSCHNLALSPRRENPRKPSEAKSLCAASSAVYPACREKEPRWKIFEEMANG